jgi:hypothetical protein
MLGVEDVMRNVREWGVMRRKGDLRGGTESDGICVTTKECEGERSDTE